MHFGFRGGGCLTSYKLCNDNYKHCLLDLALTYSNGICAKKTKGWSVARNRGKGNAPTDGRATTVIGLKSECGRRNPDPALLTDHDPASTHRPDEWR
jgi:hypothetical protein